MGRRLRRGRLRRLHQTRKSSRPIWEKRRMLRIVDLRVSYEEVEVLHGISFTVDKRNIVSLVGANGSGKSTLINTISGLVRPTSGQIFLNGLEVTALPAHEIVRKGLVQVPEGRKLFSQMT